jgi:hypothetical protein
LRENFGSILLIDSYEFDVYGSEEAKNRFNRKVYYLKITAKNIRWFTP